MGGLVSTFASAAFLFLLALFNIGVLASIWRTFKKVRNGAPFAQDEFDVMLGGRGLMTKLFRPLFALVTKSWHLFPIGFVFGLGFDTATEVALLGMAATQAAQGASLAALLVFPALFTVGMSLVDALDGMFMLNAYGWAFLKPMRKLYYNLVITALSVVVALLIGSIETLGRIGDAYKFEGAFWDAIGALNGNFGALGYAIIALFALSWAASALVYRFGGYEALEAGA